MVLVNLMPDATSFTTWEAAHGSPIFSIVSLNAWRSSALKMVSAVVPISLTPYFSRMPFSDSSMPRFRPACPPSVGSTESGRSRAMICSSIGAVSGSM